MVAADLIKIKQCNRTPDHMLAQMDVSPDEQGY